MRNIRGSVSASLISSLIASLVAVSLAGCAADEELPTGDVDLSLVGQAPSGNVYRLRNALITVQGPQGTQVLNGEVNPDQTVIHFETVVGNYTALLQNGWYLERIANGVATTVEAILLSANPQPFTVAGAQNTTVLLRFRAGDDVVDMDHGGVDIVIGVEEGPILGQSQAHAGRNCSHLLAAGASIGNGIYWIDPDGNSDHGNAVQAYCEMTTDGGGWTLLSWTGNSANAPYGVPYPGIATCPALNCERGSAMSLAQSQDLIQHSVEFAKAQSSATTGTFLPLGSYDYAGKYTYGSLTGLTLATGVATCAGSVSFAGVFHTITGPTDYNNTAVYLAQALTFGTYDYSTDAGAYIWNVGTPTVACDNSGLPPGSWMGPFAQGQYGPYLSYTIGAYSVWVRGDVAPPALHSCKEILDAGQSVGSGVYTINPDGQPLQVYCDMVTAGGGWTLTYLVDANHFDGIYLNNYAVSSLPPSGLNTSADIWNVEQSPGLTFGETLMACTQDTSGPAYYWSYSSAIPQSAFDSTTTDSEYINNFPSTGSNTTGAGCIATLKHGPTYGFAVLESGTSCGMCIGMLFGMYHYSTGGGCNSTSSTVGDHPSPYDSRSITYPICNGLQTASGSFWIGVR